MNVSLWASRLLLPLILLSAQPPILRKILECEDARSRDISVLTGALENPDPEIRRLAARALGRMERREHAALLIPLLRAEPAQLRKEAINAIGQIGAPVDLASFLSTEKHAGVRAVLYATLGRMPHAEESLLLPGLSEVSLEARIGAARGLEAYVRSHTDSVSPRAIALLRKTIRDTDSALLRRLALQCLDTVGDAHEETLALALKDRDPQVRRLAVRIAKAWRADDSYLVRYESLRAAGDCERATAALHDPNPHVALLAVDMLGNGCPARPLEELLNPPGDWRKQARALVALAKVRPESAAARLGTFARHRRWQVRAYAARAAKLTGQEEIRAALVRDKNPNVVAAAITKPSEAIEALRSRDYGLIMRATQVLEGWEQGSSAVPHLVAALRRITAEGKATSRDPRLSILDRLGEFGSDRIRGDLEPYISDFDPAIAARAAGLLGRWGPGIIRPKTLRMKTQPLPPEEALKSLAGARARIRMEEAGEFTLELLPHAAPLTAAAFVKLAEEGYYDDLTFHRIVPNFVIQGGSPGANEFVGTGDYIRDEVGLSHERGTVGISTRGRDTGDCQIFINLVDNYRLDHNYTVFARVIDGMEKVDRIVEGDVIQSIEIMKSPLPF